MLITDTNLTIKVKDMDRSVDFYQALGFTLTNRWGNFYAQLSAPGMIIGLHPAAENEQAHGSGNVSVGFTTPDLEAAKLHLESMALIVKERQEEGGEFLHFQDPDGTALYFIKPKW